NPCPAYLNYLRLLWRPRPAPAPLGPLHARPFRARRHVRAPDRGRVEDERRGDRHRREGRSHARRRQDRRPQRQAEQPGNLTPEELAMYRSHPAKGKRILEPIPFMRDIVPGCYCHHETWDGAGYPQGLMADHIPLIGRVVAVADAYDAMTSDRAYRKALP